MCISKCVLSVFERHKYPPTKLLKATSSVAKLYCIKQLTQIFIHIFNCCGPTVTPVLQFQAVTWAVGECRFHFMLLLTLKESVLLFLSLLIRHFHSAKGFSPHFSLHYIKTVWRFQYVTHFLQ